MGCTKKTAYDLNYILNKERTEQLLSFLKLSGAEIGVHTSYQAAQQMNELFDEIKRIENIGKVKITKSRNHFLASREPEDFRYYIDAGIKDDYTMGYADVAGFRLGTCRPVRWIDPITRELTSLMLHPMTIMECTLDTPKYMGISDENKAFTIVTDLVDRIYRYYGEITLLWHNDSLNRNRKDYRYSLYIKTLRYISNLLLCKTEK
jgi:virulence modulating gene E